MVFNSSLTFEFGYPHTLVQMDPAKGAGPFVWNSSDMGHWKGESNQNITQIGVKPIGRTVEPNGKFMKDGYD